MKRNTYTSIIRTLGCLLLLPVFASSCIHEDPELTADGEIGVDPTAVNIMTNLILETPFDPIDISRNTRAEEETEFLHRFTVSAYEGTQKVASQVIFQKVQTGETTISIPVRLKLHARKYQIAVWADYTGKTGDTYQLFYKFICNLCIWFTQTGHDPIVNAVFIHILKKRLLTIQFNM